MKRLLQTIFYICLAYQLVGQNTIGLPQIDNFNNIEFGGGKQSWDITQDKWGRMYFANNEGLITYDGSFWKVFPQPNKTILRSIAISDDKIYAGGQDEIGYYSPDKNGALKYTSLKNLIPKSSSTFTDVWDTEVYKESVFFRTWDMIFEYKNQSIRVYRANTGWQFMKLAGNKLIAQDKYKGLFQFVNGTWQPLSKDKNLPNFEITGIIALKNDTLLLSSLQNGLFLFYDGKIVKKETDADNDFIKHRIYSFGKINDDEYVVGTSSAGCFVMNSKGKLIQQISRPEGIKNANILSIFIDRGGNFWAGMDNGISYIAYNSAIKYIKPDKLNELSGYSARIFEKKLYIATSDGTFTASIDEDIKDISFSKTSFSFLKNSGGQCWRLDEVNNQLLLGHHTGSFVIQNNEAVRLTDEAGIWLFLPTSPIVPAKNVIAGTYAGLTHFKFIGNKLMKDTVLKSMYQSLRFLCIDNNNEIWASHPYRGIYKIQMAADNNSFTSQLFTEKDGLPSAFRNYVFRIKNRIVFTTEKGVYEYDAVEKKFIPSSFLSSVFGKMTLQYFNEDADGNIWFCSDKKIGVASYDVSTKTYNIHYFPELNGKILSGFDNIYPYSNENILIASNDGIIHLNYHKYINNIPTLNIILSQVKMHGKLDSVIYGGYINIPINSNGSQSSQTIPKIPIANNSLHFEFSAPNFGLQKNIEYSYQLVGYESTWSTSSNKTEKDYTNLPNGNYTFKVKAYDNMGNESEPVSYQFEISAPWYKTYFAYFAYILFLFFMAYQIKRLQKKKLLQQQEKHEIAQNNLKNIHQLEVEKNEKKIVELENEKLIVEVIYKNKELADANMHLLERSDALIKVKNVLEQINQKTGGNHDLKKTIQLLNAIEKTNSDWDNFALHFDDMNNGFLKKMKKQFPQLTNADLKICAYLQLNLSSKEIAQLQNLAVRGVEISRYRLRKKLQLKQGESLNEFLNQINES